MIRQRALSAALVLAIGAQALSAQIRCQALPFESSPNRSAIPVDASTQPIASTNKAAISHELSPVPLFDFHESEIKFKLSDLMNTLRDRRHEGWVLAAYPDPKTRRPLIGAGFSLDLQGVDHPQRDPLNPHPFVEPSSASLWQASGLAPERLNRILDRFQRDLTKESSRQYRRKIRKRTLPSEVTDEEATSLLRISAIQAISNAKAYCRNFDQLTGPQQMALSQLVFQMGVNLEEFTQFLAILNGDFATSELSQLEEPAQSAESWRQEHWKAVQSSLVDSQWARLYGDRASTVIAMFDPNYLVDPMRAQLQVRSELPRATVARGTARSKRQTRRQTSSHSKESLRSVAYNRSKPKSSRRAATAPGHKRRSK